MGRPLSSSSGRGPSLGRLAGASMFPDLARDDVFRLETARLWLRWPRASDEAAIHRFCSSPEVALATGRIPYPYPPGSAQRFIYAAREGNASGRDLTLVMTPSKGKREAIGSISLGSRGLDRLTLGFVLAPEFWGKGLATEAASAMVDTGFTLTPAVDNLASRRVLEKCGFVVVSTGPKGAPARGRLIESHEFRLARRSWAEAATSRRIEQRLRAGEPA